MAYNVLGESRYMPTDLFGMHGQYLIWTFVQGMTTFNSIVERRQPASRIKRIRYLRCGMPANVRFADVRLIKKCATTFRWWAFFQCCESTILLCGSGFICSQKSRCASQGRSTTCMCNSSRRNLLEACISNVRAPLGKNWFDVDHLYVILQKSG